MEISGNVLADLVLFLLILLPSVILHEVAHGWVAERFGDPTARQAGRITLDPIPHVDPIGSLLIPGALALAGQPVFGWAKPVPVNPSYFRRPVPTMALVALAGPATNLVLGIVALQVGPFFDAYAHPPAGVSYWYPALGIGMTTVSVWAKVLLGFAVINIVLAIFNVLPIPPLDGSKLLPLVLPEKGRQVFHQISQYGFLILFGLIFIVFQGRLGFISDAVGWLMRAFL